MTWENEDMRFAELFDLRGQSLGRLMIPPGMRGWVFPTEHLGTGNYIMKLQAKSGRVLQGKFIVER